MIKFVYTDFKIWAIKNKTKNQQTKKKPNQQTQKYRKYSVYFFSPTPVPWLISVILNHFHQQKTDGYTMVCYR